ncbi:MAG: hypothetical protein COA36_13230 [Desulfotalea sp.]|nr:MAG: hypothetical protein COA36_13230 [Desulfotalea sp.]
MDSSGTVVWQAVYLHYGKALVTVATITSNLRFSGQYFDVETGLYYNWNRYYDPRIGRYISADPIGLSGGMNLYGCVGGDPVNAVDPMGLSYYYGNWCGSNWSGGYEKSWDELLDAEKRNAIPPQDALDSCCQDHDRCHADCRDKYPCNNDERKNCYKRCDRELDDCASSAKGRLFGWLLQQYMDSSNPSPGLNDPQCPTIIPWTN